MSITLKVAIAEPSVIIRNGLEVTLKRLPGIKVQLIEVTGAEFLYDILRTHHPDVLLINPAMLGCYTLPQLKESCNCSRLRCIALLYAVADQSLLKQYEDAISIYDNEDQIKHKLERFTEYVETTSDSTDDQQTLSAREKEIVVGVVKGMTNKEIAEKLFLSTHTVITHRRNIAKKLQIHSASGLTIYAIVNKLVELDEIKDL